MLRSRCSEPLKQTITVSKCRHGCLPNRLVSPPFRNLPMHRQLAQLPHSPCVFLLAVRTHASEATHLPFGADSLCPLETNPGKLNPAACFKTIGWRAPRLAITHPQLSVHFAWSRFAVRTHVREAAAIMPAPFANASGSLPCHLRTRLRCAAGAAPRSSWRWPRSAAYATPGCHARMRRTSRVVKPS